METLTKETIENLHKETLEAFRSIAEEMAKNGATESDIVRAYQNQMNIKKSNYYSRDKNRIPSISEFLSKLLSGVKTSKAESIFYDMLEQSGIKFKYQYKIGRYTADFLCGKDLVVEIDGPYHNTQSDELRDEYLRNLGYRILRIPLQTLFDSPIKIVENIKILTALRREK